MAQYPPDFEVTGVEVKKWNYRDRLEQRDDYFPPRPDNVSEDSEQAMHEYGSFFFERIGNREGDLSFPNLVYVGWPGKLQAIPPLSF